MNFDHLLLWDWGLQKTLIEHSLHLNLPGNVKQRLDEAKSRGDEERRAEDKKVAEELQTAFKNVGQLKSPSGELFDELFAAHQLPTAEGAKSTKEAAEDEDER